MQIRSALSAGDARWRGLRQERPDAVGCAAAPSVKLGGVGNTGLYFLRIGGVRWERLSTCVLGHGCETLRPSSKLGALAARLRKSADPIPPLAPDTM